MVRRKSIPKRLEKKLYQEVSSKCPVCGETDVDSLVIHHIVPYANNQEHNFDDMIVLCSGCHSKADSGTLSRTKLYKIKRELLTPSSNVVDFQAFKKKAQGNEPSRPSMISNTSIHGDGNVTIKEGTEVHGDLNVTTRISKSGSKSNPIIIPGTLGSEKRLIGYIEYLISRYNEFKKWDCEKNGEKMNYSRIRVAYQRVFKYKVKDTPIEHFEKAVAYLQDRIRKTKLGRNKNSQGQRIFREFEEFDPNLGE